MSKSKSLSIYITKIASKLYLYYITKFASKLCKLAEKSDLLHY